MNTKIALIVLGSLLSLGSYSCTMELPSIYDLTDYSDSSAWCIKYHFTDVPLGNQTEAMWNQKELNNKLTSAACKNKLEKVRHVLNEGAEVTYIDSRGGIQYTALHEAAANAHPEITKILINAGANIYQPNSKGLTPLVCSIMFWQKNEHHSALNIKQTVQHIVDAIVQLTPEEKTAVQNSRKIWLLCMQRNRITLPKEIRILIIRHVYTEYAHKHKQLMKYACGNIENFLDMALFCALPNAEEILAQPEVKQEYESIFGDFDLNIPAARLIGERLHLGFLRNLVHQQTLIPKK